MARKAYLIADLGYGDAGKGSIVDFLARNTKASLVVRYNGGCQAAHNVVLPDGVEHTFSQYGSGTFAGAATFLSRFMVFCPENLMNEIDALIERGYEEAAKVYIDERAPITTLFHKSVNRIKERSRGNSRHGSCGQGIGETMQDVEDGIALCAGDLLKPDLEKKLTDIFNAKSKLVKNDGSVDYEYLSDSDIITDILHNYEDILGFVEIVKPNWLRENIPDVSIFEGAQGVLLDPRYGHWPHVTRGNTTLEQADELLDEVGGVETIRIGVTRAYAVRHGAGPLPTETRGENTPILKNEHNIKNKWQGKFRVGFFNVDEINKAIEACPVDYLAVTCLDHVETPWDYLRTGGWFREQESITKAIIHNTHLPILIESYGPTHKDKKINGELI